MLCLGRVANIVVIVSCHQDLFCVSFGLVFQVCCVRVFKQGLLCLGFGWFVNVVVICCLIEVLFRCWVGFHFLCFCFFARASVLVVGRRFQRCCACLFTQDFVLVWGSLVSLVVFVYYLRLFGICCFLCSMCLCLTQFRVSCVCLFRNVLCVLGCFFDVDLFV